MVLRISVSKNKKKLKTAEKTKEVFVLTIKVNILQSPNDQKL